MDRVLNVVMLMNADQIRVVPDSVRPVTPFVLQRIQVLLGNASGYVVTHASEPQLEADINQMNNSLGLLDGTDFIHITLSKPPGS
jgi:hypothetical protein